jgi:hypothetical protein
MLRTQHLPRILISTKQPHNPKFGVNEASQ